MPRARLAPKVLCRSHAWSKANSPESADWRRRRRRAMSALAFFQWRLGTALLVSTFLDDGLREGLGFRQQCAYLWADDNPIVLAQGRTQCSVHCGPDH